MANNIEGKTCPNEKCSLKGKRGSGNIRTHGWYKTKSSRRRRYKCNACGVSFGSTHGTAYCRLRASRQEVDQAFQMNAEGMNISAIGRITQHEWNTIDRWLDRARKVCQHFQDKHLRGYTIQEAQADEIKTFIGPRKSTTWVIAIIEVSSRLWPATEVGARSYKNTIISVSLCFLFFLILGSGKSEKIAIKSSECVLFFFFTMKILFKIYLHMIYIL
jgi:transposase-like protein